MKSLGIGGLLVLLVVVGSVHATAAEQKITTFGFDGELIEGVPAPWETRSKVGTPRFSVVPLPEKGGEKYLNLHSINSSFSLNRKTNLDVSAGTHVSWSWKGEKLPEGKAADAREGSNCDQGLQVMLAFDDGTSIISYVWDTKAPVGTRTTEGLKFLGIGRLVKVIVVQSGKSGVGKWSTIHRDVGKDFREVFGEDAKKIVAIRVQSNSQYTGTEGKGYFSPITFTRSE